MTVSRFLPLYIHKFRYCKLIEHIKIGIREGRIICTLLLGSLTLNLQLDYIFENYFKSQKSSKSQRNY